jgi:hypothetical protein
MDPRKQLLTTLSAVALGVGGFALSAHAAVQGGPQCTTSAEQCACEDALKANTIEALEDFLSKYPPGVNGQGSACTALALAALNEFSNGQQSTPPDRSGGSPYNGN